MASALSSTCSGRSARVRRSCGCPARWARKVGPDDTQPRLALPFVVFNTDLDASANGVGGRDFVILLGVEAEGKLELNETPSPREDAARSCSPENEVVSDEGVEQLKRPPDSGRSGAWGWRLRFVGRMRCRAVVTARSSSESSSC